MIEFVTMTDEGRHFSKQRPIRISDCGPDGHLRLDGAARYLQDVGTDDWDDVGTGSSLVWVARRTALRLAPGGRWPRLGELAQLITWCGGTGAAWAERRTNILVDDKLMVETASLWVPVNAVGQPQRIPQSFIDLYGIAAQGRKVSARVTRSVPPDGATSRPWALRRSDIDVIDHVNNAAIWQAVNEIVDGPVEYAELTFHGAILESDHVGLVGAADQMWLVVDDDVRVSGSFTPAR
ncbi:MAG: acyl-ACP thioesterase domain-containing protein [Acidimicrobiales bacterium]